MDVTSFLQERHSRISPRAFSGISIASDVSAKGQSHHSSGTSKHGQDSRVKLMCSHGGKILPRPSDMRLRYVGGETRMVSVPRNVRYLVLLKKLQDIYRPDIAVKYQLPEEDLDALVSVTSDEDVENMMEECDRLDAAIGSSKLRVFVFSSLEPDAFDINDLADHNLSQQRYVDAVNQVTMLQVEGGLRKSDDSGSVTSSGHVAYVWDMPQNQERGFGLQEHLQPQGFPLSGNLLPNTLTSFLHTASSEVGPPPAGMLLKEPIDLLEFASNEAAKPRSLYGAGVTAADNFRDLESGELANSSISSQYDAYNKYLATRSWALSSQMHRQLDPLHAGSADDQLKRTEPPHVQDFTRKDSMLEDKKDAPGKSTIPFGKQVDALERSIDVTLAGHARDLDSTKHSNLPLSPGAMLQKELSADQDLESRRPPQIVVVHEYMERNFFDPISPSAQDRLSAHGHAHSNMLQTQPFPHHELLGLASDIASPSNSLLSCSSRRPVNNMTEEPRVSSEYTNSPLELPAGFSELDYPSTGYSCVDWGRSQLPMFASQPFSQHAYSVVTQPCPRELSPSGKSKMDEFLQQVLSPTISSSNDKLLHDLNYGISSQAPWLSPKSSFPLVGLDEEADEQSTWSQVENSSGFTANEPVGIPKTQNFEHIQGELPLLSRLYSPGLPMFGNSVHPHGEHVVTILPEAGSEGIWTQDQVSDMLAPPGLTVSSPTEDLILSDLVPLRSSSQLNQGYDDITVELPLAAAELPIDEKPGSSSFTSDLTGLSLHVAYSSKGDAEAEPDVEERENRVMSLLTPTCSADAPLLVEASTTTSQLEHESPPSVTPPSSLKKALDNPEMGRFSEREDIKSDLDEGDTFETAVDMSLSPAAAAEVEATAHDLQIVRHCDLEELRELGSGTFGTVYHGKWRGTDVAIKRIKSSCFMGRPSERERLIADFWREAYLLGQLHHPNVVAFYGVVPDGPGGTLATVTEYMVNGSLKQALRKDRALDHRKRLLIAMDAAFGMEYLHGKNVIHFDLKCENLLVNLRDIHRPVCKVADLGLSKIKQQTLVSGGVRGTLPWMAPELLNGSSSLVSEKVDVFSFGIVLWELLTGEEPYASLHYGAIIGMVCSLSKTNISQRGTSLL